MGRSAGEDDASVGYREVVGRRNPWVDTAADDGGGGQCGGAETRSGDSDLGIEGFSRFMFRLGLFL